MATSNFFKPVLLNETSLRINLLHKTLKALGLPVVEKEVQAHTAGKGTLKQVRSLQEKLKIKPDGKFVVDQTTYDAMMKAVHDAGLADRTDSFKVQGKVINLNGEAVRNQKLIAFDVDLKGAALYRSLKSLKEIDEKGGFEYLNESYSLIEGFYSMEFFSFQFRNVERKKADVVVYALDYAGTIIGRSRLVNSEDYSNTGVVTNLDVLITKEEERTEYEILMKKLIPFLKESHVVLIDLAQSTDQVKFCSSELDEKETNVAIAVAAELLRTKEKDRTKDKKAADSTKTKENRIEIKSNCGNLSHELLYGLGRQNIALNWTVLYKKANDELIKAIKKSVEDKIIREHDQKEIGEFLNIIHACAGEYILRNEGVNGKVSLGKMLSSALQKEEDQIAFVDAYRSFKSEVKDNEVIDFKKFWSEYLPSKKEFKEKPQLIKALLLNQQLSIISTAHQPLMEELQVNRKISSPVELLWYDDKTWKEIITKTGVPEFITGSNDEEKVSRYAGQLQSFLNAAYPTQRIAIMLDRNELPVKNQDTARLINNFISKNESFEIGKSPVHEYAEELKSVAGEKYEEVKKEFNIMQRVFGVSPTPETMSKLMEKGLHSAYSIANIPKKSFIKMYSADLGGEQTAEAVYQRAEHISTLAAERAMKMYELSHLAAPALAYSQADRKEVLEVLQNQVSKRHNPNYSEIFGSPDICECEHCRSVYGAASYFVDLLRFLWRGNTNTDGKTPLDMFTKRRPDLLHLPLTCENTNTIIPYIDLVNEVMEYYTAHGVLDSNAGYDTGDTTQQELRANPQNFVLEAYRKLKGAVYPFSLPYHQPLDVIRTYSDHLKTERYEIMKAMQKDFSAFAVKALECEALRISEEEFTALTGKNYDGANDTRQLHEYFGYAAAGDLEKLAGTGVADGIHEFLRRTGMKYTELVELLKTKFINPGQNVLEYLQELFLNSIMNASTIYNKLRDINAGSLDPAADPDSNSDLSNILNTASISPAYFKTWVNNHFSEFDAIITLNQPDIHAVVTDINLPIIIPPSLATKFSYTASNGSLRCFGRMSETERDNLKMLAGASVDFKNKVDTLYNLSYTSGGLNSTLLKSIQNIYSGALTSGISNANWSKMHRFIRLWRKLGWTIHETDLMLTALGENNITDVTISKLSYVVLLKKQLKISIDQLATFWGYIDTWGEKSLYKNLFLNKAVQRIDDSFKADEFGNYLKRRTFKIKTDSRLPIVIPAALTPKFEYIAAEGIIVSNGNMTDMERNNLKNLAGVNDKFNNAIDELYNSPRLIGHIPAILAAYQMSEEDLSAIIDVAEIVTDDTVNPNTTRKLNLTTDILNIHNLSLIYRYVVFSKALKLKVKDFCLLTKLFNTNPFSSLVVAAGADPVFKNLTTSQTFNFYDLAEAIKNSGFKADALQYIVAGTLPLESKLGLDQEKVRLAVKDIRNALSLIEQNYPESPATPITADLVKTLLSATYASDVVNQLIGIIESKQTFSTNTKKNLPVAIPASLAVKYNYVATTGELTSSGIMPDVDRASLRNLLPGFPDFINKIDELFNLSQAASDETTVYSITTQSNLAINIPVSLSGKYNYSNANGKLTCKGKMSNADSALLKNLLPGYPDFTDAVDTLYTQSRTILKGSPNYNEITEANLAVTIPDSLSPKYTYTKASGRLTCTGIMSDTEKNELKSIPGTNANFNAAVDALYKMPEDFIKDNFSNVFSSPKIIVNTTQNLNITIPSAMATKFFYFKNTGMLIGNGGMTNAEKVDLKALSPNLVFIDSVDRLYDLSNSSKPEAAILLNHSAQAVEVSPLEKLEFLYFNYLHLFKQKLREDTIIQVITPLIGLTQEATRMLIKDNLHSIIDYVTASGYSAEYFTNQNWSAPSLFERNDKQINFDWGTNAPDPRMSASADSFSVRWKAYISPPSSGDYTLIVNVMETDESFKLYLDDVLILEKPLADVRLSWEKNAPLNAFQMHKLTLEYSEGSANAGVSIYWKKAGTISELIPVEVSFPAKTVDNFTAKCVLYHRAAKFITGFKLTDTEINHFIKYKADFDNLDFNALTPTHWQRIKDYTQLRNTIPQSQALLTDVFAAANSPTSTVDSLIGILLLSSAWELNTIIDLVKNYFAFATADFKNEKAIKKLSKAIAYIRKTGLSSQTLAKWAAPETDFDRLSATADLAKNAVKAKYEEEDWMKLAGDLSDKIRENQKQALISYLLTKQELIDWGVKDADGLFEYFLIDVQMGSCMETSRIVQANAAIQMYVNRCLLNLESNTSSGAEKGVSPESIDKERWEWMQYYRVWEVNRKIFLYPENWLEPEWRDDRSPFFKELESELTQNDITDRSVETAFRNYLNKMNTVANLDVCGMYQENYENNSLKVLHVFGRTHNAPYQFYYRTCDEFYKWSAWEKVQVDIRMTEDGDNSGVHLMPVVWKNRLFIFWGEFIKKNVNNPSKNGNGTEKTIEQSGKTDTPSSLKSTEYYEIRLAWSEYIDDKWSPKQLSKEYVEIYSSDPIKEYSFRSFIDSTNQILSVTIRNNYDEQLRRFVLFDIQSHITADSKSVFGDDPYATYTYANNFMKRSNSNSLAFNGNTYLKSVLDHNILYSSQWMNFASNLNVPFFYQNSYHTYFVRPSHNVRIWDALKNPNWYMSSLVDYYLLVDQTANLNSNPGKGFSNPALEKLIDTNELIMAKSLNFKNSASNKANTEIHMTNRMEANLANVRASFERVSDTSKVENSFAGMGIALGVDDLAKGFEFHTFYHPFSSQFITSLNSDGIDGLLKSDTLRDTPTSSLKYKDYGTTFISNYDPNFPQGLVKEASSNDDYKAGEAYTYYKENVCFDVYGANSIYNWELFFHAPLYIATRLSKNGKYKEAMKWFHYIFDPTTDELPLPGQPETTRYWKVLPFKNTPKQTLEEWFSSIGLGPSAATENPIVKEWRKKPFRPFVVARNRPLAFMKNVVIKYVENLREWGDSLFRQFTRESVNEALHLYVIANHILGPRPEFVPKRGKIKAETYESLKNKWDDFGNALVDLENIFPYSSEIPVSTGSTQPSLLGIGSTLYFCLPSNEKLLEHWDTIADRLFKIRHCMDIDGVKRQLALFAPPIDPAMLINATALGLEFGSILGDLSSPPPIYRFSYLIAKANEFCTEVKSLGSTLLSVLEKKDAEELGRLRASHETMMIGLMTAIKERQVLEAKSSREGLTKSRQSAEFRLKHYNEKLLGNKTEIPPEPSIDANVNAESQLPADTLIQKVETDVDDGLIDGPLRGTKLIAPELAEIVLTTGASISQSIATGMEGIGGMLNFYPTYAVSGRPWGVGGSVNFGGSNMAGATSGLAKLPLGFSQILSFSANMAAKHASYIRREQEWTLQANLAAKEIIQLDKQIISADIRIQIAQKELENHRLQIENTKQVEQFLKDKFTNQELYQWMKEQLFTIYKQGFNMAYDMAKKVEKCYQYELGIEPTNYIQYGYWDNTMQGLCAGEKLQLALRQLEKSYIEENRRELELSKSISMALVNPLALQELRTTGKCFLAIPEELFDLDYQGHYFRRIKSVSISLPCIAGPFTTINCTLRLLKNVIRINTTMNISGNYEHNNDEGMWIDDDRFRESAVAVKAIATSTGQRDSGMFELNFNDPRYLPFEGAGAISEWKIELTQDADLRQFDHSTISDVVLHINYTAREDAGLFKEASVAHLKDFFMNVAKLSVQPLLRMFSLKHEFATEWNKFLHPSVAGSDQSLSITLQREHFPFFAKERKISIKKVELLIKANETGDYKLIFSGTGLDGNTMTSSEIIMPENLTYNNMQKATLTSSTQNANVGNLDIFKQMIFRFKHSTDADFHSIGINEFKDIYLVLHYHLDE